MFACHGVGGMVGMLLTGVFASKSVNSVVGDNQGLIFETLLYFKPIDCLSYSVLFFSASYFILIVNKITPLRVSEEKEELGLDISQHGEFL
jgi:Amt family ammonium transporter